MASRLGNFIIFLILCILTLGIYPLYFFVTRQQENTELLKEAKKANAQIIYGYEMLLGQATRSFEIWLKQKAPYDVMKKAILGGF